MGHYLTLDAVVVADGRLEITAQWTYAVAHLKHKNTRNEPTTWEINL